MKKKKSKISGITSIDNKNEDFIKTLFYKSVKDITILFRDIINYLEDDLNLSIILFSKVISDKEKKQLETDFKEILDKFNIKSQYNGIKYIYFGFNLVGLFKDYKELNLEISNKNKNDKDFKDGTSS